MLVAGAHPVVIGAGGAAGINSSGPTGSGGNGGTNASYPVNGIRGVVIVAYQMSGL